MLLQRVRRPSVTRHLTPAFHALAELCDAGSLGGAIRQGMFRPKPGVRTEALARRVLLRTATELCRGMVHIHTANVLHGESPKTETPVCTWR